MHKHINTYRPLALIMAFLLLISTSGITMDMHYCGQQLIRVNLIGKAKTCAEVALQMKTCCSKRKQSCHKAESTKVCSSDTSHKSCCKNESIKLNLDVDLAISNMVLNDINVQFLSAYLDVFHFIEKRLHDNDITHPKYIPPLLSKDIPLLTQSFLL